MIMLVDMKSAFDKMEREDIWKMLEKKGVNRHLIKWIKDIYRRSGCKVNVKDQIATEFETKK